MSNTLRFDGLAELREELRNLPADLTGEAGHIVEAAANGAAATIKREYPVRTGNLRDHLTVTITSGSGQYSVRGVVQNTAKHAWLFENGSQARHTDIGANRGSMPPGHVFIPNIIRERRRMYDDLKDLLTRHGLVVSGDA